jgi:hypothetical protein
MAGGVGGGVTGLVAIAAMALLLLLKKKKKPDPEPEEPTPTELDTGSMGDEDPYISEYGFSDGQPMSEDDEPAPDLPMVRSYGGGMSEPEMASKHNPDELEEEFGNEPAELF